MFLSQECVSGSRLTCCVCWQGIGDDEDSATSSALTLMETDEGFQPVLFDPRELRNLALIDELESLCPLTDMKASSCYFEGPPHHQLMQKQQGAFALSHGNTYMCGTVGIASAQQLPSDNPMPALAWDTTSHMQEYMCALSINHTITMGSSQLIFG